MYVADKDGLALLVERLRDELDRDSRLGIDTEFIRERTYLPVLEILQVAACGGQFVAVVDVPALGGDLGELGALLLDPSVLKILHSGGQDMEILAMYLGGQPPAPVYDTQVAASFAGFGAQTGYGALVQALLNVSLSKEEGFADWSRRPLSPAMREYAENDVRYLHALHDALTRRLRKRCPLPACPARCTDAPPQKNGPRSLGRGADPAYPRRRTGGSRAGTVVASGRRAGRFGFAGPCRSA